MKRYPFSKKAMKAMLAATIAFTPIVTTGVLAPVEVSAISAANYNSTSELVEYLDNVYDQLSPEEKGYLDSARDVLSGLDWDAYALRMIDDANVADEDEPEVQALLNATLQIFAAANVASVNDEIANFRETQLNNVDIVFGTEVTVDKVLDFLADVQIEFLNNISGLDLDNYNEMYFYGEFITAMASVSSDHADVYNNFTRVLDEAETLVVFGEISGVVDTDGNARRALISALKEVQPPATVDENDNGDSTGSPGGGTPTPTPAPEAPKPPTEITLPADAAETVKEKNPSGKVEVVTKVNPEKVADIVKEITAEKSVIPISLGEVASGETAKANVPGNLFSEAGKKNADAKVEISTKDGSYELPVNEINTEELAKELGIENADDLNISISVNVVDTTETQDSVDKNGLNLASKIIEFTVIASNADGSATKTISRFSQYVERNIVGEKEFTSNNSVAVRINDDGTFDSIPTLFDGKNATIKSLTNSKYTIVENDKTFSDVDNNESWAEGYIETLASKYIIKGKDNGLYAPQEEMTRLQFTLLLVRALGLPQEEYTADFRDLTGEEWFSADVMAAVNAGIISGKLDNSFAPYEKITRAQAAVMMKRAMDIKFLNYDKSQLDSTKQLSDFNDSDKVEGWKEASESIEAIYQAGIVSGKENGAFDPFGDTKRDQMAKILAEFLKSAKLMN